MGLENGLKREFCSDCGLRYLINKTKPNMNYSFWVVAHNIQNGYESLSSSVVRFYTARSSKYFIHSFIAQKEESMGGAVVSTALHLWGSNYAIAPFN
jgi:hypothetical protein